MSARDGIWTAGLALVLAVGLAAAAWAFWPPAQPPPDGPGVMILQSRELAPHTRPAVYFDHTLHESQISCRACHHDFMEFGNHDAGRGSKCATCHTRRGTPQTPPPLRSAFHASCRGCHLKWEGWGRTSGPVACGACHARRETRSAQNL